MAVRVGRLKLYNSKIRYGSVKSPGFLRGYIRLLYTSNRLNAVDFTKDKNHKMTVHTAAHRSSYLHLHYHYMFNIEMC